MDSKYSGFLEANPTFQDRVEAFTSGLLTPDPKAVVLWSMEQGVSYTVGELHQQVREFVGDRLPISYPAMWSYCRGNGRHPGVLEKFGFVVNEMDGVVSGPFCWDREAQHDPEHVAPAAGALLEAIEAAHDLAGVCGRGDRVYPGPL